MSECVVRMEMPKNCYECEMRGAWAFCPIGKWPVVGYKKQRHEDCPIICQLPERHGRLGDLDELAAGCDAPYLCRWLGEIEDAQTIVPAEAEKSEKMKYRKKPVVIEAYQTDKELDIETLEGTMHASVGDYIITGVRGEQYPCKPDIFEQTYEPADTPASPWHSVEEPPEEHMWCFVYTDEPEMIMPIRIAFYVASCTGKGNWYHYESGEDIDDEVDYWTPMYLEGPDVDKDLPWPIEPPKEE